MQYIYILFLLIILKIIIKFFFKLLTSSARLKIKIKKIKKDENKIPFL